MSHNIDDDDGDGLITKDEIKGSDSGVSDTKKKPYVKLVVLKSSDIHKETVLTAYGHNVRLGKDVVERAIEVRY